jgi:hypothetical protein
MALHDFILIGSQEFYPKLNNKTYNILKVDNIKKEEFMINKFSHFLNKAKNKNIILGIDYEYNKVSTTNRGIALMQINIEDETNIGYIFILYPPELMNKSNEILLNLLTHTDIIKILHGGESLDIPYMFESLLKTTEDIDGFCSNLYDTKFLCNYYDEITFAKTGERRSCSIYNLLVDSKIITEKKMEELDQMCDKIGPIYNIHIDIHNISNDLLRYSLYDVIYLAELIKKLIKDDEIGSKIVQELTVIIYKYKRNIEPYLTEIKKIEKRINYMNTFYIYDNNNKISVVVIWEVYFNLLINKYLSITKNINYFKKFLELITKNIVYSLLVKYFDIYERNDKLFTFCKYNNDIFKKYPHIYKLFQEYYENIENDFYENNKKMI